MQQTHANAYNPLEIDHLAVAAQSLAEGVAYVEDYLGIAMQAGGAHPLMGTHNRLLGLADGLYLEVIAINPDAPKPDHPRWFDLDNFIGPPRLSNWILRCGKLAQTLAISPAGAGRSTALWRGDLRWHMAIPDDGKLPFGGMFPALLQWGGDRHPLQMLAASHCQLNRLEIAHPDRAGLSHALAPLGINDNRIILCDGFAPRLTAIFQTPHGERQL